MSGAAGKGAGGKGTAGAQGRIVVPGDPSPLGDGELVVLRDEKGRRSLIVLAIGSTWHSHAGALEHDALIGSPEGTSIATPKGVEIIALRPTREDFVLKMQRGAQVVYPKDQAMIVALADIRPGMRVVEAGAGSGALSLALLDAVGSGRFGCSRSSDARTTRSMRGATSSASTAGPVPNWTLEVGDVADVLARDHARTASCSICPNRGSRSTGSQRRSRPAASS
jgi:tRNA (adenine57-N1/adenine58-N1)-methyltransferase catalytic subunit